MEDESTFFAPSQSDAFDMLIDEYNTGVKKLMELHHDLKDSGYVHYLMDGHSRVLTTEEMLSKYRSYMWTRAFNLTDVMDFMPSNLRDAWNKLIETGYGGDLTPRLQLESGFIPDIDHAIKFDGIPEFTDEGVRNTIGTLMRMREAFLSSMVDGIFFNLSGEHVTNRPEGFSKRIIVNNVYTQYYFGMNFNFPLYSKVRYIHDLRFVIGKLLRRDPILYGFSNGDSDDVIRSVVSEVGYGQWCWIDGNAIKIRCYKKGTVHIELHPELTWQLNTILANKHPNAIPRKFTIRSEKMRKERVLIKNVINEHVIKAIRGYELNTLSVSAIEHYTVDLKYAIYDKWISAEIERIMQLIGGVKRHTYGHHYEFCYNPDSVLKNILTNRLIPDQKSHQFYPSPECVVHEVYCAVASIAGAKTVCEPSCGTGNILDKLANCGMGYDLTAYEINPVFAEVSRSRVPNANVITGDFIDVKNVRYDVVAMNPPFDQGRWLEHVQHALTLSDNVVAVLPEGADCDKLGCEYVALSHIENAFDDTSITVKVVHFTNN